MAKREKPKTTGGYQNRKTGDFERKNQKTDLKSDQNRKNKKPSVPLMIVESRTMGARNVAIKKSMSSSINDKKHIKLKK